MPAQTVPRTRCRLAGPVCSSVFGRAGGDGTAREVSTEATTPTPGHRISQRGWFKLSFRLGSGAIQEPG